MNRPLHPGIKVQLSDGNEYVIPKLLYAARADLLTPEELAERLKVSVNWVYEKSRTRGKHSGLPLPCLRMGRYLRFAWPDIVAWMRDAGK